MSLAVCPDVSPAGWLVTSTLPWTRLVTFGPSGFGAYARLRSLPDPAYPEQSENEAEVEGTWWEDRDQLTPLLQVLGSHTTRSDDCYVCVWEGYTHDDGDSPVDRRRTSSPRGETPAWYADEASSGADSPASMWRPSPFARPASAPKSPSAPRAPIAIPDRAYFLFHGPLTDLHHWGDSVELRAGRTRLRPPYPAFVWPADRAWCIAGDVDSHWTGIGADTHVIDRLVDDARLDVVPADPDAEQPRYR